VFMDWLSSQRPDLVPRYRELYRRGAYAPREERDRLSRMVRRGGRPGAFWRMRPAGGEQGDAVGRDEAFPPPAVSQGTLF
jgi:hypothetical protein